MRPHIWLGILASAGIAVAQTVIDPAALKNLSLQELSQIEVTTPSRVAVPAFRTSAAISVLTGDDLRRAGVTTIPDALRLIPGVNVARIDGSKWSVGIRGFGSRLSRSVLVLIDGRSVYTPLFAGTYWEVQDTLLQDVERIEVIRGPGGTIWGPNAVNGVINIITKSAEETQGTYVSMGGGNVEQGFANARYGGATDDGLLSYRVYGKGYTRAPQYHFGREQFDDWRGGQTGFRSDWRTGDDDTLTIQGDVYRQENGQRVDLAEYTPPSQRVISDNADLSGGNVLARWTRTFSAEKSLQLQTYYDRTNRFEPNLGERRDTFDIDLIQTQAWGARHMLTFGGGIRLSHGRFERVSSGLVFDPAHRLDYLLTGFVEDTIDVHSTVQISVGAKFLRTNFEAFTVQPSARILWSPDDRNAAWAAVTRAIRTPSRVERDFYLSSYLGQDGNGTLQFARFDANRNFESESLNGYEAGYRRFLNPALFIDIAAFWNSYGDLLSQNLVGLSALETTLPFPNADPPPPHALITGQFRNDLRGFTTGGEIAPEWRPTTYWRLRGSYSYLNMNLSSRQGAFVVTPPASVAGSSPRHQVVAQSGWDLPSGLQLDLTYRYVSALPAMSIPAYGTADVRFAWRSSRFEVSVVGKNLFQPHHLESAGDPGGPIGVRRSAFVSLSWMN